MPVLDAAIADYAAALNELQAQADAGIASSSALRLLLARDEVARALAAESAPAPQSLCGLADLDARLRTAAPAIDRAVGSDTLAGWRRTVGAPADAWWWSLDREARDAGPQPSALWAIVAGFFLTVAVSLAADVSRRFLTGGPDFIGVFSTISQAALALLAGTAFIQIGPGWIERTLSGAGIDRRQHHLWKAGLALVVLLLILALRLSLPWIARLYSDRGVRLQAAGRTTSAIESYQRAINLNADAAQAHYNLATAYEDILDFDSALTEYQTAIRADPALYAAQVNLARLYNLRKLDYASALRLLNTALAFEPIAGDTRYSLYKNRGWAHFGLKLFGLAEEDLRRALVLRPDGAAAHCLLAQVQEAKGASQDALASWGSCLAFDGSGEAVEADWHATAQERLAGGKPQ